MAARLSNLWEHSLRGGPLSGDADDTPAREYRYCRFLAEIIMTPDVSGYGEDPELPGIKLPLVNPSAGSADNAATAANPGTTGSSARAIGWDLIRRETGLPQEDSGRRCGNH